VIRSKKPQRLLRSAAGARVGGERAGSEGASDSLRDDATGNVNPGTDGASGDDAGRDGDPAHGWIQIDHARQAEGSRICATVAPGSCPEAVPEDEGAGGGGGGNGGSANARGRGEMEAIMLVPVLLPPEAARIVETNASDGAKGWKKLSYLKKHHSDTSLRRAPLVSPRPYCVCPRPSRDYCEGICLAQEALSIGCYRIASCGGAVEKQVAWMRMPMQW